MSAHALVRRGFWREEFHSSINLSAVVVLLEVWPVLETLVLGVIEHPSKKKVGRQAVLRLCLHFAANRSEARCQLVNKVEVRVDCEKRFTWSGAFVNAVRPLQP